MLFNSLIPFSNLLGFKLVHFEGGESAIEYAPKPEHLNTFAVVHGGAVMTLLDVALASAARSVADNMAVITIEMKTSFMRAAPGDGSIITARGHLLHRTAKMAFVEAKVYDAQSNICAHATGTFKYVRSPYAPPDPTEPAKPTGQADTPAAGPTGGA
jgi:uncharacterized protein (TIGR00369 family)